MFDVDSTSITRGYKFQIKKPFVKYKKPKHFFRIQVVNDWDSFSSGVANAVSLDSFKTKIMNDGLTKSKNFKFSLIYLLENSSNF